MAKSRYELTISTGYVPNWTYIEAVRELFQNALDNEVTSNGENSMFIEYDENTQELKIGNKTSKLTLDTLLLGSSSKRDDDNTIGKHGEGYKIAFMVLLREGKLIKVENYGAKELWTTRLVKARRYNNQLVPEIVIEKGFAWVKKPNNDLTITITNVTPEEYEKIKETNLHIKTSVERIDTVRGSLLTGDNENGNVYVNGLFICHKDNFKYGYDLKPKHVKLDRDRRLIDSIDLGFITADIWKYAILEDESLKATLISLLYDVDNYYDLKYLTYILDRTWEKGTSESKTSISDTLVEKFVEEHGEDAVPVENNDQLREVLESGANVKPVMVNKEVSSILSERIERPKVVKLSAKDLLIQFKEKVYDKLDEELMADLDIIIDMM